MQSLKLRSILPLLAMNKNNSPKIHNILKNKDRLNVSLEFFKQLLTDPEKKTQKFLQLYEFIVIYNKCFVYESEQILKKFLTKNELEATSFSSFEDVFQKRVILSPLPEFCEEKDDSVVFQGLEFSTCNSFVSNVFRTFNSSSFGTFSQNNIPEKSNQFSLLEKNFFQALLCENYSIFLQKNDSFETSYNLCLKETLQIWYARKSLLLCFFSLKDFSMSRFYLLISLFYLDQKLRLHLTNLYSFNFQSREIRFQANKLLIQSQSSVVNIDLEEF